jgi:hypothetical protein
MVITEQPIQYPSSKRINTPHILLQPPQSLSPHTMPSRTITAKHRSAPYSTCRVPLAPKNIFGPQPQKHALRLRIPRVLRRPVVKEINVAPIVSAFPNLVGVPPEYIREHLPSNPYVSPSPSPLSYILIYIIIMDRILPTETCPNAHARSDVLPTELDVIIDTSVDGTAPTHLLAVYSSAASPTPRRKVVLYPAHNLVLAAHCAHLPFLPASQPSSSPPPPSSPLSPLSPPSPPSSPLSSPLSSPPSSPPPSPSPSTSTSTSTSTSISTSTSTTLPVVPLCLPSPDTFSILHTYLTNKRVDHLRNALLPIDAAPWNTMAAIGVILGLWRNACALGIVDDGLWDAVDAAWGSVVGAMAGYSC